MSVSIEPAIAPLSDLISFHADARLDDRKLAMLDWCRSMSSEVWTGRIDGDLVSVWGLIPPTIISTQAYLWMHATDRVSEHKFLFVRHSQRTVERMLEHYQTIIGHCLVGAQDSIRWVRWLGGEFSEPEGPYVPFRIERRSHGPV